MYIQFNQTGTVLETNTPNYHDDFTKITKKKALEVIKQQAFESLHEMIEPNKEIYTKIESVSRSGMSRTVSAYIQDDGQIICINWYIANLCRYNTNKHGHLKVPGCGFCAGFDIVYSLGCALWPDGTDKPHGTRNGKPDKEGGYALTHNWL